MSGSYLNSLLFGKVWKFTWSSLSYSCSWKPQCISHGLFQGAAFLPPRPHLHAGVWFVFYFVRIQSSLIFSPVLLKRNPHSVSTGDSFAIRTASPGGRILGYDVGYLFPDPKVVIGSMCHLEQINCTLFQVCIPKLGVISPPYLIKVPRG